MSVIEIGGQPDSPPKQYDTQASNLKEWILNPKSVENVVNLVLSSFPAVVVVVAVAIMGDGICDKMWDVIGLTLTACFLVASLTDPNEEQKIDVRAAGTVVSALSLIVVDSLDLFGAKASCNATALRVSTGVLAALVLAASFNLPTILHQLWTEKSEEKENESKV